VHPVYPHACKSVMCVETMNVSLSPLIFRKLHAEVFVCLPCYNEAKNISNLLSQIHSTLKSPPQSGASKQKSVEIGAYQILAVNDGSTDSKDLEKNYPLTVINHRHNQGLAEAYRTLIKTLKKQAKRDDIAVFMDADNTHSPKVIRQLVDVASTMADVVVASRYKGGAEVGVPLKRRILSKIVNWLVRNLCGIPVLDCTSGYRAYRLEVLQNLPPLESKGFEITAEILIDISSQKSSYKIKEIPLILHYERKKGPSKIHVGQTIKAYVKLLWKHSKIDLTPFLRGTAYKISHRLGKTYDKDPIFWNDGMLALAFLIVSFFIYDGLTHTLPQAIRFIGYVGIAFISFCIQHFLRRFWVFQKKDSSYVDS
jgi:dolichol-phosphate mannosyltransferase